VYHTIIRHTAKQQEFEFTMATQQNDKSWSSLWQYSKTTRVWVHYGNTAKRQEFEFTKAIQQNDKSLSSLWQYSKTTRVWVHYGKQV